MVLQIVANPVPPRCGSNHAFRPDSLATAAFGAVSGPPSPANLPGGCRSGRARSPDAAGHERTPHAATATLAAMHYDAHQPVINDLEARIVTIRDSL